MPKRNKNLPKHPYSLSQIRSFAIRPLFLVILILLAVLTVKTLQAQISNFNGNDDVSGISSLMNAVVNNDVEGVKFFVKAGPDIVNQKNLGGATPLHLAARNGYTDITELLVDNGADVNATDNEKWTPLMRAASAKNPEIMALLLDKGADPRKSNLMGETAIIHSADSECLECLNTMFTKYDFSKEDDQNLHDQINKAYTIARNKNNNEMQTLLSDYLTHLSDQSAAKANDQAAAALAITTSKPENLVAEDVAEDDNNIDLSDKDENIKNQDIGPIGADKNPAGKVLRYRFIGEVRDKNQSQWQQPAEEVQEVEETENKPAPEAGEVVVKDAGPAKKNIKYVFKKMEDNSNKPKESSSAVNKAEPLQVMPLEQSHPVTKYKFKKLEDHSNTIPKKPVKKRSLNVKKSNSKAGNAVSKAGNNAKNAPNPSLPAAPPPLTTPNNKVPVVKEKVPDMPKVAPALKVAPTPSPSAPKSNVPKIEKNAKPAESAPKAEPNVNIPKAEPTIKAEPAKPVAVPDDKKIDDKKVTDQVPSLPESAPEESVQKRIFKLRKVVSSSQTNSEIPSP